MHCPSWDDAFVSSLYFVVFTIQLFKSIICHPNHCIHHLLPSDRKAKQNDKKIERFLTILTTGVSRKLMTSLFWWLLLLLLLLLVPWSAWTVGARHGLYPFGSVFGFERCRSTCLLSEEVRTHNSTSPWTTLQWLICKKISVGTPSAEGARIEAPHAPRG